MRHLVVIAALASAVAAAPPGATAVCRDGTYSYSQHRSGTCSRHGGVARWLGPRAATEPVAALGATVPLGAVTRTHGCRLAATPDRRCSPGAYYSGLTTGVICAPGFRTATIRNVSEAEKHAVEAEYGLPPGSYGSTLEIDHIVPLELGGSNAVANLFPERAPGFRAKDRLENALHERVCAASMSLGAARRRIATNWEAIYRTVFGTGPVV